MEHHSFHQESSAILAEISEGIARIDEDEIEALIREIQSANRLFCIGAGRSGIVLRAFCMRLNHLGLEAFWIGGIPCPPAYRGDLVIASSGSGSTHSVMAVLNRAKSVGARIAAITSSTNSDILPCADTVVHVNAPSELMNEGTRSSQPMRTLFEQLSFIICESVISALKKRASISEEDMANRHTNLE